MQSSLVTSQKKHEYLNSIYNNLHPPYDPETRIYTKVKPDFDFKYKDDGLMHSKYNEIAFTTKSMDMFKSFKESDLDGEKRSVHSKISYYLSNNMAPGFNHESYDQYKKEKFFISPDLYKKQTFKVDKWYHMKKDDLNIYYEKFFLDKVIYRIIDF